MIAIRIPLITGRGLNDRMHWSAKAKAVKYERGIVCWAFCRYGLDGGKLPGGPFEVKLVRVYSGRGREMDDDGWVTAAKAVRDQVAAELHVNDGNKAAIHFEYEQERGEKSCVRIEIATRVAQAPAA